MCALDELNIGTLSENIQDSGLILQNCKTLLFKNKHRTVKSTQVLQIPMGLCTSSDGYCDWSPAGSTNYPITGHMWSL